MKRKKRLMKQREGLIKQAEKHREKLGTEKGKKDTTPAYWAKEIERYEEQTEERAEILEKLKKKKRK